MYIGACRHTMPIGEPLLVSEKDEIEQAARYSMPKRAELLGLARRGFPIYANGPKVVALHAG